MTPPAADCSPSGRPWSRDRIEPALAVSQQRKADCECASGSWTRTRGFADPGLPCLVTITGVSTAGQVVDNAAAQRFELEVDGQTAFLAYERANGALALIHTEVPEALRGHHIGERLVKFALETGRTEGSRIVAVCPFVRAYLRKHPLQGRGPI